MTRPLQGAGIVIARAEGRGESLRSALSAAGADVLLLPVIAIRALPAPALPDAAPDWLIFTSSAAVTHGVPACRDRMTPKTRVAAIGRATARTLADAGLKVDAVPTREESEGLLALPEFAAMHGRNCWIVRGIGGRELLAGALAARGAAVALVEVYERGLPETDMGPLLARWRTGNVNAMVVASASALINLHAMLDDEGRRFLRETQLVAPTERMIKLAHEFHIRPTPLLARNASDDAQLAVLEAWWRDRHQDSR